MKLKNSRNKLLFALMPVVACLLSVALHAAGKPRLDDATVLAQAEARPPGEPKLDPNLQNQLSQALNPARINLPTPIRNPFIDRGGLTRSGSSSREFMAPGFIPSRQNAGTSATTAPPAPGTIDANGLPLKPFAERYRELQRQSGQAKSEGRAAPRLTTIYSINEIEIYGHHQNGGAWIYSKAEERAFTIPVNSEFIDAIFIGFEGDEAVFKTKKGRTVRLQLSRENP